MLLKYDQLVPSANGLELVKGRGFYDLGVFPRWRHAASVGLSQPRVSFGLTWKFVGGFQECDDDDCKGLYRADVSETPVSRQGQLKQHVRSVRVLQIRNSDGRLRTYGRNQ